MENTSDFSAARRTRRTTGQWDAILADHFDRDETAQELADRLGCALSTVELQMKRATAPEGAPRTTRKRGFVEVKPRGATSVGGAALSIKTETGVTVTFAELPPPAYLAAALGLRA